VLAEQQRLIADQRVEEILRTQELKLVSAMVEGQEQERKRIAQDLHDRLGSMLSAIKLRFSALEGWISGLVKEQQEQFKHLFDLLDHAVVEVRKVSHDMARSTVREFGLRKALEDMRDAITVPGRMDVELNLFGLETPLPPRVEIAIYRMVQELVSNALKHARARQLTLQLTRSAAMVNVLVSDDGRGFDPATADPGMGMDNIRARAAEINGSVQVDSRPGHGTTISVDIPL
jgi:signal transduction histidine kinase